MRHTPRSVLGTLLAAGALLATGVLAGPASAAPDPLPDTSHSAAPGKAAQERVRDFWTPDRMRAATPLDLRAASPADTAPRAPRGTPATVPPSSPATAPAALDAPSDVGALAFPAGGGPWTGGGDVVTTAGRVFFTYGGRTASCSGNAVTSANRSTVITAGHCVRMDGAWHTNWVFVPGYRDGQRPYGTWAATSTHATAPWVASEDINHDVGAAVVAPLDGQRLTDVVGGQGLAFNTGYNRDMYAFGFPAAAPYDGEKFIYCSGRTSRDFLLSRSHGMVCDMTGGSSGGPWFTEFDEATGRGLLSSVNSFKYNFLPNRMYGPYFGPEAQTLYQQAQAG